MEYTKQKIDELILIYNNNTLDVVKDNIGFDVFQIIHSYLLTSYPGYNQKPLAAAILITCISNCQPNDNIEIERMLIKTIILFDFTFDKIRNSYTENDNGNLLTAAAELVRFVTSATCELLLENNGGDNGGGDNGGGDNNTPFVDGVNDVYNTNKNQFIIINNFLINDDFFNISGNDQNGNITFEIITQPTNGTISNITRDTFYYTPNTDFIGVDTLTYRVLFNGTPVAQDEPFYTITINVNEVETPVENPFLGSTITLCTEEIQGRITYALNQVTSGISSISVIEKALLIPTATPNEIISTTNSNLITPTGDQRAEIANFANTENKFRLKVEYTQDAIVQTAYLTCVLPNFGLTDNMCVSGAATTFEGLYL